MGGQPVTRQVHRHVSVLCRKERQVERVDKPQSGYLSTVVTQSIRWLVVLHLNKNGVKCYFPRANTGSQMINFSTILNSEAQSVNVTCLENWTNYCHILTSLRCLLCSLVLIKSNTNLKLLHYSCITNDHG